jgi:tight adherence protein C
MTTPLLQLLMMLCWGISAAAMAAYVYSIAREITYVTLPDGRKAERKIPLVFRLLLPFAPNFFRIASLPSFAKTRDAAKKMLIEGGLEGLLSPVEFVALKFLVPLIFGSGWCILVVLLKSVFEISFFEESGIYLSLAGVCICWVYPLSWLRNTRKARHLSIMRSLPFVLDLLTLSVESGMDFMSALRRNCERGKTDALNEELIRMSYEVQMGSPRRQALRNMADRVGQSDLTGVVHALVQADELGVSIGTILRIQSEQLRSRRFDRAERLASEAPVKMLGPLMLCIFPAVFIILLGPILMQSAGSIF